MYRAMRILAIIVLAATIVGAGLLLYGLETFAPVVETIQVAQIPATEAQEIYDDVMTQVREETFTGRLHDQASGLSAQACTFVTYSARLHNRGFFPAEWISFTIQPAQDEAGRDVLQLDNNSANVLAAQSRGDIAATILRTGTVETTQRTYEITCYVLGRQIRLQGITP